MRPPGKKRERTSSVAAENDGRTNRSGFDQSNIHVSLRKGPARIHGAGEDGRDKITLGTIVPRIGLVKPIVSRRGCEASGARMAGGNGATGSGTWSDQRSEKPGNGDEVLGSRRAWALGAGQVHRSRTTGLTRRREGARRRRRLGTAGPWSKDRSCPRGGARSGSSPLPKGAGRTGRATISRWSAGGVCGH
jgi:hypothetical protein